MGFSIKNSDRQDTCRLYTSIVYDKRGYMINGGKTLQIDPKRGDWFSGSTEEDGPISTGGRWTHQHRGTTHDNSVVDERRTIACLIASRVLVSNELRVAVF